MLWCNFRTTVKTALLVHVFSFTLNEEKYHSPTFSEVLWTANACCHIFVQQQPIYAIQICMGLWVYLHIFLPFYEREQLEWILVWFPSWRTLFKKRSISIGKNFLQRPLTLLHSNWPKLYRHYVASDWVCNFCLRPFYGFLGTNGLL